jgi:hypothetical protein
MTTFVAKFKARDARGCGGRKRGNSLRALAADLAACGYVNAASVASMLGA